MFNVKELRDLREKMYYELYESPAARSGIVSEQRLEMEMQIRTIINCLNTVIYYLERSDEFGKETGDNSLASFSRA